MEVHNYTSASGYKAKLKNWKLLNSKVLSKFGHYIPALSAMHPDREPHPNCGVSKDEIEFMRNVINGNKNVIFVKIILRNDHVIPNPLRNGLAIIT